MKEKIVMIINKMADYLNISQMKKLQEVLLQTFSEKTIQKEEVSNDEYLRLFLDAKQIEGCSERTIQYYSVTVDRMLQKIETPVRKISTEEIRKYLVDYQKINDCSKVTVDNVRRNISSFFFLARGRRLCPEKPNETNSQNKNQTTRKRSYIRRGY